MRGMGMSYPSQNTGNQPMRILLLKEMVPRVTPKILPPPSCLPFPFYFFHLPFFFPFVSFVPFVPFVSFDILLLVVFSAIQLESPPLDIFCTPISLSHSFFLPFPPTPFPLSQCPPASASDHHTCFPFSPFFTPMLNGSKP